MSATSLEFDDFGKIRILPALVYEESDKAKEETKEFMSNVEQFQNLISTLLQDLQMNASVIQQEQLHALGLKSKVESATQYKQIQESTLKNLIVSRQAELNRLIKQTESLLKVKQEQIAFVEHLSNL